MEARLKYATEQPYRPRLDDKKGLRESQLLNGMKVFGADPKVGIRPLPLSRLLSQQHRAAVGRDQMSLQDTLSVLEQTRDRPIDIVTTSGLGLCADVKFEWKGWVRKEISIIAEFNGWKPELLHPGIYLELCINVLCVIKYNITI